MMARKVFSVGYCLESLTRMGLKSCTRHLDSKNTRHHDDDMRTTVTLDKDVERMLREAQHRSRRSFKEVLNAAIRAGLTGKTTAEKPRRFALRAKPMGLRKGIDPTSFNKLADDLEIDAVVAKSARTRRR